MNLHMRSSWTRWILNPITSVFRSEEQRRDTKEGSCEGGDRDWRYKVTNQRMSRVPTSTNSQERDME
jgi:hypothetical protein